MGKGKTLRSDVRHMVLKVMTFFENEKRNRAYLLPVDQAMKRTAMATGVSERTLRNIKHEALTMDLAPNPLAKIDRAEKNLNSSLCISPIPRTECAAAECTAIVKNEPFGTDFIKNEKEASRQSRPTFIVVSVPAQPQSGEVMIKTETEVADTKIRSSQAADAADILVKDEWVSDEDDKSCIDIGYVTLVRSTAINNEVVEDVWKDGVPEKRKQAPRAPPGETRHQCYFCPRSFKHLGHLKHHLRIHTDGEPVKRKRAPHHHRREPRRDSKAPPSETRHQCHLCPRSFKHLGHLKLHFRLHTGEKPKCDTCKR